MKLPPPPTPAPEKIFPQHGIRGGGSPAWQRWLAAGLLLAAAAGDANAQLGPYPIRTRQASFEATIHRRDKDILWIERKNPDGSRAPQVGLAVADIVHIQMPRPALFDQVEKLRATPGATDEQFAKAHAALDTFLRQTRPLRDISGIPANEAVLLKGRLYSHKGLWTEALRQYQDLLAKAPGTALATNAQILAGIAYSRLGEHQFAVEYLGGIPIPEDDEALLSDMLFALGQSYYALGNYDNALMSYLALVVFYPYIYHNEVRGLTAALACYAQLQEWEPLYRTLREIKKSYPDSPAAKRADEYIERYRDQLAQAGQFVEGEAIVSGKPATAQPGTVAAPPAPSGAPPPADPIEYPEDL